MKVYKKNDKIGLLLFLLLKTRINGWPAIEFTIIDFYI